MSEVVISKFLESKPRKKFWKHCESSKLPNDVIANYKELEKEAIEYLKRRESK